MFLDRATSHSLTQEGSLSDDAKHIVLGWGRGWRQGGVVKGLQAPRNDLEGGLKLSGCRWEWLSPVRTEQGGLTERISKDFGESKHGFSNRREPKVLGDFSENGDHLPKGSLCSGLGPCRQLGTKLIDQP